MRSNKLVASTTARKDVLCGAEEDNRGGARYVLRGAVPNQFDDDDDDDDESNQNEGLASTTTASLQFDEGGADVSELHAARGSASFSLARESPATVAERETKEAGASVNYRSDSVGDAQRLGGTNRREKRNQKFDDSVSIVSSSTASSARSGSSHDNMSWQNIPPFEANPSGVHRQGQHVSLVRDDRPGELRHMAPLPITTPHAGASYPESGMRQAFPNSYSTSQYPEIGTIHTIPQRGLVGSAWGDSNPASFQRKKAQLHDSIAAPPGFSTIFENPSMASPSPRLWGVTEAFARSERSASPMNASTRHSEGSVDHSSMSNSNHPFTSFQILDQPTISTVTMSALSAGRSGQVDLHSVSTMHTDFEEARRTSHSVASVDSDRNVPVRSAQHKLDGAPKSLLYALFGKDPYRRVLGPSDYVTWSDGGPPHNKRYTSIFIDPITGELFKTGRYGPEDKPMYKERDGFYWYPKKMFAEHGAAARAHDCLEFRRAGEGEPFPYIGNDEPYHKMDPPSISTAGIPADCWKEIAEAQARAPKGVDSDDELERYLFS